MSAKIPSYEKLFIGGQWCEPSSSGQLAVYSPSTEEAIATIPAVTAKDLDKAITAARKAFDDGPWPKMSATERSHYLLRAAEEVAKRDAVIASSFTAEVGGPGALAGFMGVQAQKMWNDAATFHSRFAFEHL